MYQLVHKQIVPAQELKRRGLGLLQVALLFDGYCPHVLHAVEVEVRALNDVQLLSVGLGVTSLVLQLLKPIFIQLEYFWRLLLHQMCHLLPAEDAQFNRR